MAVSQSQQRVGDDTSDESASSYSNCNAGHVLDELMDVLLVGRGGRVRVAVRYVTLPGQMPRGQTGYLVAGVVGGQETASGRRVVDWRGHGFRHGAGRCS